MSGQTNASSDKTPHSEQQTLSVRETLHQTALKAPSSSGVYLWRNKGGTIIYVGKAKNLKNRLSSYFSGSKDIKTQLLISHASSIEYITTTNEYEAFLLENNLIKKHTPRYNIALKDGKSYPVIRITNEKFPRIFKTRTIIQDGSQYFGPFPDSGALDSFIEALYDIYPLRHCKKLHEKSSPCMYYHIGRCKAPCCKKIENSTYTEFIDEIATLLEGKGEATEKKIEAAMKQAAGVLNFEKAARLRDGLKALSILQNQNIVETFDINETGSRDYIASWREGELVSFTVLKIRSGKLLGRDNYRTVSLNEDNELLPEFLRAFYTEKDIIPPYIYVGSKGGMEFMTRWFEDEYKIKIQIVCVNDEKMNDGSQKLHQAAFNMALENAHEDIIRRLRERGDVPAMKELQQVLGLEKLPVRIEGFDIAHIAGKFPVASMISFYNGNPDKKNYRYFRLKTTDGIIDDFASMKEATARRYTRLLNEEKELPDFILIDGGIGQVNAVQEVLDSLGLEIPIAGLAEKNEEIYRPRNSTPIVLPRRSDALRLLQRVRDETHRFATSRNQTLRTKENIVSPFTQLPYIGKEREKLLIKKFGDLQTLAHSTEAEIAQTLNLNAEKSSEILMQSKMLYSKQKLAKDKISLSLDLPGTTAEKAAKKKLLASLAEQALEVASPEDL